MKLKKIVNLIPGIWGGGAERVSTDLAECLSKHYDLTTIIYNSNQNKKEYHYTGKLIRLNIPRKETKLQKILRNLEILKKIKNKVKKISPDFIISHTTMSCIHNALIPTKAKKIFVVHGEFDYKTKKYDNLSTVFFRFIYSKADCIVFVSDFIKKDFQKNHQLKNKQIVIHNGIDTEKINQLSNVNPNIQLPENYFVYLAQLRPEKNHLRLIESIHSFLIKNNYKLLLIGSGNLEHQIKEKIKSHKLENYIFLLGRKENPFPILKKAKASIVSSTTESFSLVTVESLLLGIPVISTDCGGPREILAPNYSGASYPFSTPYGIIVDNKNPDFDKACNLLINHYDLYDNKDLIIERGKLFSSINMANHYLNLMNDL